MSKQAQLIEYLIGDIITFIAEDLNISVNDAFEDFYNSETFRKLNDFETGLYLESPTYVYDIYKTEMGKIIQD